MENIDYEKILKLEKRFINESINKDEIGYEFIQGRKTSKLLISCPHSVPQLRNGKIKKREVFIGSLALLVQKKTGCHLLIKTKNLNDDANYDADSNYKKDLKKYIEENDIRFVFDLHGLISTAHSIIIGTCHGSSINHNFEIIKKLYNCFLDKEITGILCDRSFSATGNTVTSYVAKNTSALSVQIEIDRKNRNPRIAMTSFLNMYGAICDIVNTFDKNDKLYMKNVVKTNAHFAKYDQILEFKNFNIQYYNVPDNYVGMEIEMGLVYNRNEYTFIQKHLKKIKNIVGEDGNFFKDFSVYSEYPIEIAFDPLSIDKLISKYTKLYKLMECSQGHIYSKNQFQCGIHLNINKAKDMSNVHQKLINYIASHPKYFKYNKFKKFKFISDYDEYVKNQKEIMGKYVFLNYGKPKLIEIRNINSELTPYELECLCKDLIFIIHGFDHKLKTSSIDFVGIYENVLKNLSEKDLKRINKNNRLVIENIKDNPKIGN